MAQMSEQVLKGLTQLAGAGPARGTLAAGVAGAALAPADADAAFTKSVYSHKSSQTTALAEKIANAARAMGLSADIAQSNLSASRYVYVSRGDVDAPLKIRVSDHVDKHGGSDFDVRVGEGENGIETIGRIASVFGVEVPERYTTAAQAAREATAGEAAATRRRAADAAEKEMRARLTVALSDAPNKSKIVAGTLADELFPGIPRAQRQRLARDAADDVRQESLLTAAAGDEQALLALAAKGPHTTGERAKQMLYDAVGAERFKALRPAGYPRNYWNVKTPAIGAVSAAGVGAALTPGSADAQTMTHEGSPQPPPLHPGPALRAARDLAGEMLPVNAVLHYTGAKEYPSASAAFGADAATIPGLLARHPLTLGALLAMQPSETAADDTLASSSAQLLPDNSYVGEQPSPAFRQDYRKGGTVTHRQQPPHQAIAALRRQGRNGDTELAHVNRQELALLDAAQGGRSTNPVTGLPEYFKLGKVFKNVLRAGAGLIGGMLGGPVGAAAGTGLATALTGGSMNQALAGAALGGLGQYGLQQTGLAGLGGLTDTVRGGLSSTLSGLGLNNAAANFLPSDYGSPASAATAGAAGMPAKAAIGSGIGLGPIGSMATSPVGLATLGLGAASLMGGSSGGGSSGSRSSTAYTNPAPSPVKPMVRNPTQGQPSSTDISTGRERLWFENVNPWPNETPASDRRPVADTAPTTGAKPRTFTSSDGKYELDAEGNIIGQLYRRGGPVRGLGALAAMGRRGDTELAHLSAPARGMLKAHGGSGRRNPRSGLREYNGEDGEADGDAGAMGVGVAAPSPGSMSSNAAAGPQGYGSEAQGLEGLGKAADTALKTLEPSIPTLTTKTFSPIGPFTDLAYGTAKAVGPTVTSALEGLTGLTAEHGPNSVQGPDTGHPGETSGSNAMNAAWAGYQYGRRLRGQNPALAYAAGGSVAPRAAGPVAGPGGGQDDLIDARLADGEHVIDADAVSALGDGSNAEGHRRLEQFKRNLRKHKRSAPAGKIPPKAKGVTAYMAGGRS